MISSDPSRAVPERWVGKVFINRSELIVDNPTQLNYGVAVLDVDGDGEFEAFVAGFGAANLVLKWNGLQFVSIAGAVLADRERQAIGVAAADLDGDGREEIYVLNTDTYSGRKRFSDRLFDWQGTGWVDLFSEPKNRDALNLTAGRSVIGVDRNGDGHYGFFVANYGGPMRLYELDFEGKLVDRAPEAGIDLVTGGRGLLAGPIISERVDLFAANERGPNFLFRNGGDGTFKEVGTEWGVDDPAENGRGVATFDAGGYFGIVYGNWEGAHRLLYRQGEHFIDLAPKAMTCPARVRTVIAADFDNDGYEEIFFNNIGEPNRLFGWRGGEWTALDPGDALEPIRAGTGAAVADFDHDGQLELLISHGESVAEPLSLFHTAPNDYAWLRVLPLTAQGAPARGALVTVTHAGRTQRRIIDSGSGYLCQMEPVAHFGLGTAAAIERVMVRWPDGKTVAIDTPASRQLLRVPYPK